MTALDASWLFGAAVIGSAINAFTGGGGLVAFPTLVFTGVPLLQANAVTMVALWPGNLASVGAYRRDFPLNGRAILPMALSMALGGGIGAWLVVLTPPSVFKQVVPYLLLFTTLLFSGGPLLNRTLQAWTPTAQGGSGLSLVLLLIVGIYGGYFGSGLGILLLAILSLTNFLPLTQLNALKVILVFCNNSVSSLTYMASGAVAWPQALVMIAGAIGGGYGGAYYDRRLNQVWLRRGIILLASAITLYFFSRR